MKRGLIVAMVRVHGNRAGLCAGQNTLVNSAMAWTAHVDVCSAHTRATSVLLIMLYRAGIRGRTTERFDLATERDGNKKRHVLLNES